MWRTFKLKYVAPLVGFCFLLTGCNNVDFTKFDVEFTSSIVIPSSSGINLPFDILTPDVETNSEAQFEVNDTRKDLIEEILLKQLTLTITVPEEEDFSFLKSINIFINADGLPELEIAWNNDVTPSADSPLSLNTTPEDIKEYIKKDEFSLRCKTVTDEVISQDYYIDVYSLFDVDAKLIK